MEFEFDRAKSEANRQKHGVSLDQARQIWDDAYIEITARTVEESRWIVVGKIHERLYACVFTRRGESLRLISCRRAREKEAQLYHAFLKETPDEESETHGR